MFLCSSCASNDLAVFFRNLTPVLKWKRSVAEDIVVVLSVLGLTELLEVSSKLDALHRSSTK